MHVFIYPCPFQNTSNRKPTKTGKKNNSVPDTFTTPTIQKLVQFTTLELKYSEYVKP